MRLPLCEAFSYVQFTPQDEPSANSSLTICDPSSQSLSKASLSAGATHLSCLGQSALPFQPAFALWPSDDTEPYASKHFSGPFPPFGHEALLSPRIFTCIANFGSIAWILGSALMFAADFERVRSIGGQRGEIALARAKTSKQLRIGISSDGLNSAAREIEHKRRTLGKIDRVSMAEASSPRQAIDIRSFGCTCFQSTS